MSPRGLVEYCVANMAHYMVPRFVEFATDLPRTPTQKVRKAELKARAACGLGGYWDREQAGMVLKR